jgi:putative ABC transport system ATP-binding protein
MVMTLLRRLVHERDVLAIVATHDPLMMELADHLVELRDGEVVGEEEATHVSAAPRAG